MIEKDRELLGLVAIENPHLAASVLNLCNVLEDAKQLGELPSPELMRCLGEYVAKIGLLIFAIGDSSPVTPGGEIHTRSASTT